ncbi:plastocyanin/azurin family copper-binding protein [Natronobacterium texcoconense]|uniref:TAT (Twin-arginine translocation) pathway signal sequence n=1 Tax=Natronobacterium texcoconense TaxID=1095778 RepID=A0A1H1G3D5_NATTX|nr:plastocyanin/azurin family copper-binding protein [Natronobacterium texcoconense]SDR07418.1 TAT (twin-arginine translocation) pathway signal sequence [Natronobacterium texcoconense]
MRETNTTRRKVIKLAGAAGAAALVAGCADEGNGEEEPADDEEEPADDEEEENGNGEAIEPGTDIEFDAQTPGWEGIAPSEIEGEENPTLTLEEGEDYTIGWPEESDGAQHNIEIWDEDGEVVDDLETEVTEEPSEDQVLEFTASEEMAQYVCEPHETTMIGDLEIV